MASVEEVVLAADTFCAAKARYNGSYLLSDSKDYTDRLSVEQRSNGSIKTFFRMDSCDFGFLISIIGHQIGKQATNLKKVIQVNEKLAVTLGFLAAGDSYTNLSYLFKISKATISLFVPEVCDALTDLLKENIELVSIRICFHVPLTKEEWLNRPNQYYRLWNFLHCIGSMEGKHVSLQRPIHTRSYHFNYKVFFSTVLVAFVDANYSFTYVSVGCQGRLSDGGAFAQSTLKQLLEDSSLNIPNNICLPERNFPARYVLLADDAFPLKSFIMGTAEHAELLKMLSAYCLSYSESFENHSYSNLKTLKDASYTPVETLRYDDSTTATLVPGQWRVDGIPTGTLIHLKRVPKKLSNLQSKYGRNSVLISTALKDITQAHLGYWSHMLLMGYTVTLNNGSPLVLRWACPIAANSISSPGQPLTML
ncbi:hypothetical protein PR048_032025 [Dryococelus australis]|uniref:DDE Tnp4 domain-containing protein n=1 Tax=Dryococelus australis TaxID=614101 RepID=A0ABQ9GAY7_9NEOP|nr:hypothetical protein PR048_032025 [Dryococelus australis]